MPTIVLLNDPESSSGNTWARIGAMTGRPSGDFGDIATQAVDLLDIG
ncbi:MAG: hypothetical protein IPG34_15670 [Rhodocyclaceae bacterium]|nr:hypothetical protein [Rhodocyclaceae bacterium]